MYHLHAFRQTQCNVKCNKCSFVIAMTEKLRWLSYLHRPTDFPAPCTQPCACICTAIQQTMRCKCTSIFFSLFEFCSIQCLRVFFFFVFLNTRNNIGKKTFNENWNEGIHYMFAVAVVERHSKVPFAQWNDNNLWRKSDDACIARKLLKTCSDRQSKKKQT